MDVCQPAIKITYMVLLARVVVVYKCHFYTSHILVLLLHCAINMNFVTSGLYILTALRTVEGGP